MAAEDTQIRHLCFSVGFDLLEAYQRDTLKTSETTRQEHSLGLCFACTKVQGATTIL